MASISFACIYHTSRYSATLSPISLCLISLSRSVIFTPVSTLTCHTQCWPAETDGKPSHEVSVPYWLLSLSLYLQHTLVTWAPFTHMIMDFGLKGASPMLVVHQGLLVLETRYVVESSFTTVKRIKKVCVIICGGVPPIKSFSRTLRGHRPILCVTGKPLFLVISQPSHVISYNHISVQALWLYN